ncbi:MAG: flavin-binding protein dodecin [Alphaproteobacteria bacterium]|jgi:flavin-binding protein dodecin
MKCAYAPLLDDTRRFHERSRRSRLEIITREPAVSDHVYKHIDVTGTSAKSSDDAVRTAVARAGKSIHGMKWFKVLETRGDIDGNAVLHWQVTIQIGFAIDD